MSARAWAGAALAGAAALSIGACKDTVEPLALAGPPAAAAVSTGDNQSGAIGSRLAD